MSLPDICRKLLDARESERLAKDNYEELKQVRISVEKDVELALVRDGVDKISVDGSTIYCYPFVTTRLKGTPEDTQVALKEAGLGYLVKLQVNTRSLRSSINEIIDRDGEIPPCLAPFVEVGEISKIGVRRS